MGWCKMETIKDHEYYQNKIDLNQAQRKAWTALVRAVNRCKKENIYFYQMLEHLGGLNGNNVDTINTDVEKKNGSSSDPDCLQSMLYPHVTTCCSFADDNHFVVLKT